MEETKVDWLIMVFSSEAFSTRLIIWRNKGDTVFVADFGAGSLWLLFAKSVWFCIIGAISDKQPGKEKTDTIVDGGGGSKRRWRRERGRQ